MLVGMQTGAATVENSMEVPQKTKNRTLTQKDTCNPVFKAALFTIAKGWKELKCPSMDEWIKKI